MVWGVFKSTGHFFSKATGKVGGVFKGLGHGLESFGKGLGKGFKAVGKEVKEVGVAVYKRGKAQLKFIEGFLKNPGSSLLLVAAVGVGALIIVPKLIPQAQAGPVRVPLLP